MPRTAPIIASLPAFAAPFRRTGLILLLAFAFLQNTRATPTKAVTRAEYLAYLESTARHYLDRIDEFRAEWKAAVRPDPAAGYRPPAVEPQLAAVCANLHALTGKAEYLDAVADLLLHYGDYRALYPEDFHETDPAYATGLPAAPSIFSAGPYIHACHYLMKHRKLRGKQRNTLESDIAATAGYLAARAEWGATNRTMLYAFALGYAAKALPKHPQSRQWRQASEVLAGGNSDQWQIEDATLYNGIWMHTLLAFSLDLRENADFPDGPVARYYYRYFLRLLSPAGLLPDYGDAWWGNGWAAFVPVFECAARITGKAEYRWAAARMLRSQHDPGKPNVSVAMYLSDACRWADFSLEARQPEARSGEILESVIGKKVVFRDGWDSTAAYLLLNYRDEGPGGLSDRNYLRQSIPMRQEKAGHGHSDENSIVLLMHEGQVLLHDGGYRETATQDEKGRYRADHFHNRLVVRRERLGTVSPLLPLLEKAPEYQPVRTHKVDFLTWNDIAMSRTRLVDEGRGYTADRIVAHLEGPGCFVVIDVLRAHRDGPLTAAALWHTQRIHSSGDGWYDTAYDNITDRYAKENYPVGGDQRLWICFPGKGRARTLVEVQRRHRQEERAIALAQSNDLRKNEVLAFVTVLWPHGGAIEPEALVRQTGLLDCGKNGVGVWIRANDKRYLIAAQLDLEKGLENDGEYPRYEFERQKVRYEDYTTDGHALLVVEEGKNARAAASGATKLVYRGKTLLSAVPEVQSRDEKGRPARTVLKQMRLAEAEFRLKKGK